MSANREFGDWLMRLVGWIVCGSVIVFGFFWRLRESVNNH